MKIYNYIKPISPILLILILCSFNINNVEERIESDIDIVNWETCLRDASGKIASSYSNSVLNVEYEYAQRNFKVIENKKNPSVKSLNVKMTIHWSKKNVKYFVEGNLKLDSNCCDAFWKLSKSSSNLKKAKAKLNLGCVGGSSSNTQRSMGVGQPFVRKRSKKNKS